MMKSAATKCAAIMILILAALLSGCAGKNLHQEDNPMAVMPTSIGDLYSF